MPQNFPEIWLRRVIRNISEAAEAPFLDDIPELDAPIIELAAGSASEKNVIHIPATTFKPEVLINNTTYPLAVQQYADDTLLVTLDKYQTLPTEVSDDQVIGAAYDKIDTVTRTHTEAIREKKYGKAMHALAPAANTVNTPVIVTTGEDDGTGRKRLIYDDLVTLRSKIKGGKQGLVLVLCDDHFNDLLLDRKNFGDSLVNYKEGGVSPRIAGFQLYNYEENPYFDGTTKLPFGAVPAADQWQASVMFKKGNVAKKTGLTKQYYSPASTDTKNQTNSLAYRHYYIALPLQQKFMGAIASAPAA
jgi:hypothetical protein